MNQSWEQKARLVQARAGDRCEYCRMHQSLQGATFYVEHVEPGSRGGSDDMSNLAWCRPSCNLHKSDRIACEDPLTGVLELLFHPRRHRWQEHFKWVGYEIMGVTSIRRATVHALQLNGGRRIPIRKAEGQFWLFPDKEP